MKQQDKYEFAVENYWSAKKIYQISTKKLARTEHFVLHVYRGIIT